MNGYRYTNADFVELHVTSAVQTDEDAIAYIERVEKWFPRSKVLFIEKRDSGQREWRLFHNAEEQVGRLHVLPTVPVQVPVIARPAGTGESTEDSATKASEEPDTTAPRAWSPGDIEYDPAYAAECSAANARLLRVLQVPVVILKSSGA